MQVRDYMECFTKLSMAVVCYVYVFTLETAESECIDMWPFCYKYNPPCLIHIDNATDVLGSCPKRCGLCTSSENDSSSVNVTCRDKLDCSPFNLIEGCQSNNTWFREHCPKSCNMCFSDNETTEGCETRGIDSTIKTGINLYNASSEDVHVAGRERSERDKEVIISVIGSVVFIIVVGNVIVYFVFVKNRKGDVHNADGSFSICRQSYSCNCSEYHPSSIDNMTVTTSVEDTMSSRHGTPSLFFRACLATRIVTRLFRKNPGEVNDSKSSSVSDSPQSSIEYLNVECDERNENVYMEYPTAHQEEQTGCFDHDGLHYATLEMSKKQVGRCHPPPISERTEYASIDLQKSTTSIFEESEQL